MKNIIISVVVSLFFVPNMASAANPFISIHEQLDELNADVTELDDRVKDNSYNIISNTSDISANSTAINNLRSVNIHVNGIRRGAFIDAWRDSDRNSAIKSTYLRVLLDSGYFATINVAGDGLTEQQLLYQSVDCSGQGYAFNNNYNELVGRQGLVFESNFPDPDTVYMIQSGTPMEVIQLESVGNNDGSCMQASLPDIEAYKMTANNPALTGVTQSDFVGEVTLGL